MSAKIPLGYSCTTCPHSSRTICRKYEAGQSSTNRIKLVSYFKLEQCQLENGEYIRYGSSREGEE